MAHTGRAQTVGELAEQLKALREEIKQLKADLQESKQRPTRGDATPQQLLTNPSANAYSPPVNTASSPISLFGYGEVGMVRPRKNLSGSVVSVGRGVFGLAYRFNETTRLVSELEIENAVVSAGDRGEIALEQF